MGENKLRFSFDKKDRKNSILIVGVGATNKHYNDIVKPESKKEMIDTFGDCQLTDSYIRALDFGASGIYVMNIEKMHDYISASSLISQFDFTYIVPIDVRLSDFYYDPTVNKNKKTYYVQQLMESLYLTGSSSTVITTDDHADLYEDIDAFINAMNKRRSDFKQNKTKLSIYRNVVFVLNNLSDTKWANVDLAAIINISSIDRYPVYKNVTNANVIFNIDTNDVTTDMAYFKKHADSSISIENLLNMDSDPSSPIKFEPTNRIQKYIFSDDIGVEKFIGRPYTSATDELILDEIIKYMDSFLGYLLIKYDIKDISSAKNVNHAGCVSIFVKMNIQPIGCVEKFEVTKIINGNNIL